MKKYVVNEEWIDYLHSPKVQKFCKKLVTDVVKVTGSHLAIKDGETFPIFLERICVVIDNCNRSVWNRFSLLTQEFYNVHACNKEFVVLFRSVVDKHS